MAYIRQPATGILCTADFVIGAIRSPRATVMSVIEPARFSWEIRTRRCTFGVPDKMQHCEAFGAGCGDVLRSETLPRFGRLTSPAKPQPQETGGSHAKPQSREQENRKKKSSSIGQFWDEDLRTRVPNRRILGVIRFASWRLCGDSLAFDLSERPWLLTRRFACSAVE